ncbi:MAG: hypothetical protein HY423_02240 [Candidatus Lambdaproteobacteria bacterium]|nr:hypothetical protein [Candidatus Lambdaproteobacteria bacterium]
MPILTIQTNSYSPLIGRISELVTNLTTLESAERRTSVELLTQFVTPLAITPLAHPFCERELNWICDLPSVRAYLETVSFPCGRGIDERRQPGASYFPIVHVSLAGVPPEEKYRRFEVLHNLYLDLLKNNINDLDPLKNKKTGREFLTLTTASTFGFLLGEIGTNVNEHADASDVYLFAQYWPKVDACELCLVDNGRGLCGSLLAAGRKVTDDLDAIRKVVTDGLSSKYESGQLARGTGIRNTIRLLTNQVVNGEFAIISGKAGYVCSPPGTLTFVEFGSFAWQGTIVHMRLKRPTRQVSIYDHIA